MSFEIYENYYFLNLLLRNCENHQRGWLLNSFSQNCKCTGMKYLGHYVCSGIELLTLHLKVGSGID